jgi:hypothetical protein
LKLAYECFEQFFYKKANFALEQAMKAQGVSMNNDLHRDLEVDVCLAKSRDLHKSTKKDSTFMRKFRPYSSWTTWA